MLPEPCEQNPEPPEEETNSTGNFSAASVRFNEDALLNAASLLVKESIWSRGLYAPPPTAYGDLMAHLGKELAQIYWTCPHM